MAVWRSQWDSVMPPQELESVDDDTGQEARLLAEKNQPKMENLFHQTKYDEKQKYDHPPQDNCNPSG